MSHIWCLAYTHSSSHVESRIFFYAVLRCGHAVRSITLEEKCLGAKYLRECILL